MSLVRNGLEEGNIRGTHLLVAILCELDPMIWDHLVDLAVLVAFRLGMADEVDQLGAIRCRSVHPLWLELTLGLTILCSCVYDEMRVQK